MREKLLLRQIDVLKQRPDSRLVNSFADITFITSKEEEVLSILRNYGLYQNLDSLLPFLENEEEENLNYSKCITNMENCLDNKILSESIINLTVKESSDLISKSNDLKLKSADLVDAVNLKLKNISPSSSITLNKNQNINVMDKTKQAVTSNNPSTNNKDKIKVETKSIKQTEKEAKVEKNEEVANGSKFLKRNNGTTSSKKKVLKNISNLTLNNCGTGNIILKNISNLTINTCKQVQKSPTTVDDEIETMVCKESKTCMEVITPRCEFYEKLISENEALKRTIVSQSVKCTTFPDPISAVCMSPTNIKDDKQNDETYSITNESVSSSIADELEDGFAVRKPLDSPIEEITTRNMHLAESFLSQPPIIQCWLSNLETELENNIEILEFSKIA